MTKFATLTRRRQRFRQKFLNVFILAGIILVPIFPASWLYAQRYTWVVVRWQIDESTIIDTMTFEELKQSLLESADVSWNWDIGVVGETSRESENVDDEALLAEAIEKSEEARQSSEDPKKILYRDHVVTPRQTLWEISQKYGVSIDELKQENPWLTEDLKIDQKILIPKIQWVEYTVKNGDTLSVIAREYGISSLYHILLANDLTDASRIRSWQKLLLPNPTKTPTVRTTTTSTPKPTNTTTKTSTTKTTSSPSSITYGAYTLTKKVSSGCRNFAWGNCTCFVAQYKEVTWRGNAKQWLANARKQGKSTGSSPTPGAIIVYDGPGFPPAYGHVGIVMEVNDDWMIIKDMNYSWLNVITTRKEKFNNPAIKGYIYVD